MKPNAKTTLLVAASLVRTAELDVDFAQEKREVFREAWELEGRDAPLEGGPGNPNSIYYGSDRLYRSADNGTTHTIVSQAPIESGIPLSAIGISPQNDNVRIVGLANGGIYGTTTGSTTLTNLDPSNTVPAGFIARAVIDPTNVNTAYVTISAFGVNNIFKTTNLNAGTPTWTNINGTGANVVPLDEADNWLHLALAVAMTGLGLSPGRTHADIAAACGQLRVERLRREIGDQLPLP